MTRNPYLGRLREESLILSDRTTGHLENPIIKSDIGNLRSHLLRLDASGTDKPGYYYYSDGKRWMPSTMTLLKEQEEKLQQDFENFVQSRLNIGDPKPTQWPPNLAERKEKLTAQVQICHEEIDKLKKLLQVAQDAKKVRENQPVNPRHWGAGQLKDNILVEFCGWVVAPDDTGLLRISDPNSPFNFIEIWRLKAQIVNPLHFEWRLRQRKERQLAEQENRKRKEVQFPKSPVWNKDTDLIEYEGYSNETIKKIKQEI